MTVGEKIQFYRKRAGLSQEELGQKLIVSRQTISLWEMDKTLPTVDNLLRLKEVFCVEIDELLSESEPGVAIESTASETYNFEYDDVNINKIYKLVTAPLKHRFIIFLVVSAILLFLFVGDSGETLDNVLMGFVLGYFLIGLIIHLKTFFATQKDWKARKPKLLASSYLYEIYEDRIEITVNSDGVAKSTIRLSFDDIDRTQIMGEYFFIEVSGQFYVINKEDVPETSRLHALCRTHEEKRKRHHPKIILRIISIVLMVLSILSVFYGFAAVGVITAIFGNVIYLEQYMWMLYLFIPIPLASVIFGYVMKKKGYFYKKNVITGFIMIGVLILYGSFTFIIGNAVDHSDAQLLRVEETVGIDLPEPLRINVYDYTNGDVLDEYTGEVKQASELLYSVADLESFESVFESDERWISEVPSALVGVCSEMYSSYYDYIIIYNVTTGEFNTLPEETGNYQFINILYSADGNLMMLVEYDKAFIAD